MKNELKEKYAEALLENNNFKRKNTGVSRTKVRFTVKMKTKDYKIRLLPETNQVLLSAKDYKNYVWMVKQIKEDHK